MRDFLIHLDLTPNQVYARQVATLAEIKNKDGYDAWLQTLRQLLKVDLWFFMRYAMRMNMMDEILHGRTLMKHYAKTIYKNDGVGCDLMTLIPRTHCKTTFASAFLTQEIINDVNISIGVVSGTEPLAKNISKLIADTLTDNEVLQEAFPDLLPNANNPPKNWGIRGYFLPTRTSPRTDPTLKVGSVTSNLTGTHPDILLLDDIVFSDKESDLEASEQCFIEALGLLGATGKVIINGTRWSDKDLYGKILDGRYTGNLGGYETLVMSCWADEHKTKPVYDKKVRPDTEKTSGFSREDLARKRINNVKFYNCQYLNEPSPEEDQQMKVSDIQIYKPDETPVYTKALVIGAEIVGTSITFPVLFRKVADDYNLGIYLQEIRPKRSEAGGPKDQNKLEKIFFTLAPIIQEKLLYVQQWMIDGKYDLAYEIKKFGSAKNDDIVDALHMIPMYMSSGIRPGADRPAQAYVVADLAFTESEDADWTVFMAVAIDHKNRHFILDYKRYKQKNPIQIAQDLIKFFQQINSKAIDVSYTNKRRSKFAQSYT